MCADQHTLSAVINALVWTVPIGASAVLAGPVERLELWTVLSLLMVASAVVLCAFAGHGHARNELDKAVAVSLRRNR